MIKPTRMIAELMKAKEDAASFERAIEMTTSINNEVAIHMRFGVLTKLTEKVDKIQTVIDNFVKTHHILFETPFYEKAYISLFRDGKTIVKTYDLHEHKDIQDWVLTRSKTRFDDAQESDDEGYYWAIVRYDYHLSQTDVVSAHICNLALTPAEGNGLFKQLTDWQNERDKNVSMNLPNYVYFPNEN